MTSKLWLLLIAVCVVIPSDGAIPSRKSPNSGVETRLSYNAEQKTFKLEYASPEEMRIVLCGTVLSVPPYSCNIKVDPEQWSLTITESPQGIEMVTRMIQAADQAEQEKDMSRRLMQMWVRMVRSFDA